jgi:DNA repair/transcription protein MET18/MMS19
LGSQENTLLDVVQSLGEYINDEDSRIRGRAVSYLTAVLSALPPKFLSRQQIDVLCQFFSDRIEDGGAIEGLIKLQSLDRFTNEMAQTVVRA